MLADQPLLSIPEVAEAFAVSETSIRRWVKSGALPSVRLPSGTRKVRREDVQAILRGTYGDSGEVTAEVAS